MRQTSRRAFGKMAVGAAAAGLLSACGGNRTSAQPTAAPAAPGAAGTAAPQAGSTIRVGYVPVLVYSPLFVAQERGYFREAGITVELVPTQGGSDPVVQLAAGNFDAAVGGIGAGAFNAAKQGVQFTIVAPMHSERPPLATKLVIGAKNSEVIKTVADLKGKKVAINATGAATEYWLDQALQKNGLTMQDIDLTTVAFRDVPAALESGSLDAAMLGEPLVTINVDNGILSVLADDFIDGFTATYLYMGEPLLANNAASGGFMRAYLRACRDMQGDYMTPELAAIIEKYTQVPAAVVQKASLGQYDPNGTIPLDDLATLQSYFLARGVLEYSELLDIGSLVNQSLANTAAGELGNQ
ncbi:MAG: ABC transporter substrate-binding protein [Roseiflexaceae bacterium]|nr:ABC transporter substrate-binding protein [Roseiflexaceae bacterium]